MFFLFHRDKSRNFFMRYNYSRTDRNLSEIFHICSKRAFYKKNRGKTIFHNVTQIGGKSLSIFYLDRWENLSTFTRACNCEYIVLINYTIV